MTIESTIQRACTDTAVYWGSPVNDGFGGKTFASPIEISVKWQDKTELINRAGERDTETIISNAIVYVLQDIDELGWLYLGEISDIDSSYVDDPKQVEGAYEVKKFGKTKGIKGISIVRKVYL